MKTVTIVAKGPSAARAQEWINECDTDVAVINESGLLLDNSQAIRFAFFSHSRFAGLMEPLWDRIQIYSGPAEFHHPELSEVFPRDLPAGFPADRHRPYSDWSCCGDRQSMIDRIIGGGIVHHHTTTGAHHWLAKIGYKRIRLIGVDGGRLYARGIDGRVPVGIEMNDWNVIHKRLADLLDSVYGTTTEWYR